MPREPRIFVVDDDADLRGALIDLLGSQGLPARGFDCGEALLRDLDPEWDGVVLCDMRMPGLSGLQVLAEVRKLAPEVPVVMLTAHGDIRTAVTAVRQGAMDFLEKPAAPDVLKAALTRALNIRRLQIENRRLRQRIERGTDMRVRLMGRSAPMRALRGEVIAVAPLDVDVLLRGEPGTGKDLAARCLHDLSPREGDFVALACEGLTEANFDGIVHGEGDGRAGALQLAQGGTLYLDRVDALAEPLQARLLAVLDRRNAGGALRIVSSVAEAGAARRALRDDLYYRLAVAEIALPPLRDREDDFFLLFEHFVGDAVARHRRRFPDVAADELRRLRAHRWPGNLRELRNAAERLVIGLRVSLSEGREVEPGSLDYDRAMADFEASLLRAALLRTRGRKGEAAEMLRIPRKRLYLRLRACNLLPPGQD